LIAEILTKKKYSLIFSVLLPAFDGRPGRTNINATQDIPVPTTMTLKEGKEFIESFFYFKISLMF